MSNKMISDICLNLSSSQYKDDYKEVIIRARETGIEPLLCSTDLKSLLFNQRIAPQFNLKYTSGCHPHHAKEFNYEKLDLKKALTNKDCLFVGECGLDYNRNYSSKEDQLKAFREQLTWAEECKKPLLLHDREASEDMLKTLDQYQDLFGVLHCATAPKDLIEEYIKREFYIGYTPWIMDLKRGGAALESMLSTPLDKLLIESDGPYLPVWENGKKKYQRSESSHLPDFISFIAEKRNISVEELGLALNENFFTLINTKII